MLYFEIVLGWNICFMWFVELVSSFLGIAKHVALFCIKSQVESVVVVPEGGTVITKSFFIVQAQNLSW